MKGFKSFADPAKVQLSPGVTVVVGPNGSGKSNVVDALAWVLGAQGPKQLRSTKMEDVIFAGGTGRPPLGRAEVTLVFDNADGTVKVPLSEIAISRQLFRSGESEYQLNGASCRLSDLVELLSDAGVGKTQHVIISQGEVDDIVNSKTEERRTVIEEAAGILKYKRRRERAERRISEAEDDLARVAELQRDLRRQIKPLHKQAESAKLRADLKSRHRAISLWMAQRELSELGARMRSSETERQEVLGSISVLGLRRKTLKDALDGLPTTSAGDVLRLETLLASSTAVQERLSMLLRMVGERQSSITQRRRMFQGSSRLRRAEVQVLAAESKLASIGAEGEALLGSEARCLALELELAQSSDVDPRPLESDLQASRSRLEQLSSRRTSVLREQQRADEARVSVTRREAALSAEYDKATVEGESISQAIKEARVQSTDLLAAIELAEVEVVRSDEAIHLAEELHDRALEDHNKLQSELDALESMVVEMREGTLGSSLGAISGFRGLAIELIEADEGYEFAVESALGPLSYHGIVDDAPGARQAYDALVYTGTTGSIRVASELVAKGRSTAPAFLGEALLSRVVVKDPLMKSFFDAVLGDCMVVEDDQQATWVLEHGHAGTVVTKAGHRFTRDEATIPTHGAAAISTRRERLTHRLETTARVLIEAKQEREVAKATRRDRGEILGRTERELSGVESQLSRLLAREEDRQRLLERLRAELADLPQEGVDLESSKELANELRLYEEEISLLEPRVVELGSELERARALHSRRNATKDLLSRSRQQVLVKAAELEARTAAAKESRVTAESELAEARLQCDHEAKMEFSLESELQSLIRLNEWANTALRAGKKIERELSTRLATLKGADMDLARRRAALVVELEEVSSTEGELRERLVAVELSAATAATRYEATTENHVRYLEATLDEIESALPVDGVALTTIAEEKLRLEKKLAEIGDVNAFAASELAELTTRMDFLEAQSEDVRASRRELSKVVSQIEAEMHEVFMATLNEVASNFEVLFERLFPGGAGTLRLAEGADPLTGGIDLLVDLPTKKVRRLSLLSGGERSLVGLAFLFAVFRARPAPFVVLDEVEAALDDRNLSAFVRLIEEFRATTQLLVITHQKRTMEIADVLIGVSVSQQGASRLVREDISSYLPLA